MQTSIRIVVLDYYMSTPIPGLDVTYSEFRGTIVNQVPILRCFGSTENGKKICVHIHGVFPYLYIPYDGRGKPEELMHQISVTLDKAINVSFNQASSNAQHIYKISLVSGIPMYGYHSKKHQFFKIYLYNPNLISKVGSFFINRKVLEQMFQPHEIHLNFTLQFMIDYNLHGMSNMLISEIRYRMNLDSRSSDVDEHLFLPPNIEKNSLCELEADINAESILNRQEILSGNLAINPGIATLWDEEKQRRRNKNENSQLGHFLELKNMLTAPTKTHIIFQQALKERLAVLSTDKDIVKQNPDGSIYPAETPHDSNIQNASLIDIHSSSSLELSLDDTLNMPHSQSHDETITSSGENLNLTMDQDAQDVLRLLAELAAETVTENENEDESILSQVVPDDQNDESAEDFLDLSMPLASLTTPTKIVTKPNDDKSDDEETDYFNTTLIPQMDGQIEYTDSDDEELTQQSPQKIRQACGKSMPLLDVSNVTTDSCTSFASPLNKFNLTPYVKLYRMKLELTVRIEPLNTSKILTKLANNRPNTRARNRQTTNNKLDETLRLMRHRINRIDRKSRIKKIGQRTRKYEINTLKLLKQTLRPKCNIVPGRKWFLESHNIAGTNGTIISRLLELTHNYTDPGLHIFVNTPSIAYFFYYGGCPLPATIEIPADLTSFERKFLCDSCVIEKDCKQDSIKRRKLNFLHKKILNIRTRARRGHASNTPLKRSSLDNKTLVVRIENSPGIVFKDSPNRVSQVPKSLTNNPVEETKPSMPKYEADLRREIREANFVLQTHLRFLRDINFMVQSGNYGLGELDDVPCLRTNAERANKSSVCERSGKMKIETNVAHTLNSNIICANYDNNYLQGLIKDDSGCALEDHTDKTQLCCKNTLKCSKTEEKEPVFNWNQRINNFGEICDTDYEVASIMDNFNSNIEKSDKIALNPSSRFKIRLSPSCGSEYELPLENAILGQKGKFKRSISSSLDSDYASFSGNASTRQTPFTYENDLSLNLQTSNEEMDFKTAVDATLATANEEKKIVPESLSFVGSTPKANELRVNAKSDCSSASQKVKPQIHVISDIQLLSPFKIKFERRSASSIPFGNGTADKGPITSSNDEKSTFSQGAYSAKCVGKRRHTIPSMYINCDGAVDSSSEDERKTNTKRKAVRRKLPSSQYTPLGITVTKSPKVQGNYQGGLADNTVQITGDHEVCQESASKINPSKLDIPHKRKLIFENETTSFNHTTSEEFISCMYSPKPFASAKSYQDTKDIATRKLVHTTTADQISATNSFHNNNKTFQDPRDAIHLSHVSKQSRDTSKNDQNKTTSQVHIDTADPHKKSVDSNAVEPNNSQNYDSTSSDSDLFSDNDGLNRSFFKSYNLTISEKYDNEYMYKAKEGCSTKFSPNSMPNSISSLKSQQHKVLSDNSSSDIPPYQNMSQYNSILNNESIGTTDKTDAKKNCNLTEATKQTNNNDRSYRVNIIKPSFKAPSRLQVERSLTEYKIPHVQQQEPYYSNVDDYTGVVEIGHRIMRIASKTSAHLSEFDSEFNGLNNHRKHFVENVANLTWNSNNVKNLRLTHCSNKTVTVHPVKKPPSVKQVREWVKAHSKSYKEDIASSPEAKTERTKIHIPTSPGNDADLDLSLSLTPYTDSESFVSDPNDDEAHKSLPSSQLSTSPVLSRRKKRCELNCKPPSLRDSVLLSEETNKSCQITGISQENTFGFNKSVQNLQAARALTEHQCLTTMVMELHIRTRGDLKADPQFDCICAIFYSVFNDVPESSQKKSRTRGVIAVNSLPVDLGAPRPDFLDGIEFVCDITYVQTEEALINSFLSLIKYWDPDIFAGYEIQMLSWGYLVDRAFVLSINIVPMLGRSELHKYGKTKLKSLTTEIESNIIGRIVLDVWRIMRHEIALQSYTFESIVYHILHRRVPMYPFKDITFWWDHRSNLYRHRVLRYYLQRVDTVLELFDKLDFLNRTSELARLFGILFYEVLSRGSQFRVESMMLRLAKPLNYIPVSPDVNQRAQMKAPEYIALVMEPESKLYTDPVIVLDFQSLYPSIIIAYNYCFTTCVGRVRHLGTNHPFPFGATQLKVSKKVAEKLCKRELLNYSPCGVAFVRQKVREGILPRMLKEVLDTRLMVKNSMKENKGNDNLQKVLHNRQLGLKLIANVTYGYTAANFSGRMCCVEVGDSVVSKGRETLQRAIALVESTPEWEAKVVYGDTDSMFVLVPGKTKEEAFEVGKKIADAVTADNPDPIKLKLEKVYQPCILQTKKRYVGYMYETPDQKEPVYEAKGIETVRRDGCPAVAKILQKCLTLLFETKNVSLIKSYVLRQFHKIQTGRASIQDLTFAKEYRGASGYKPGACVPALELARKWKVVDRRNEPRSGERVPYIIVNGPPGLPLIRLVKSPRDLLNDTSLRPNALYYITKVIIPPVNRCLNLIGADLNIWFNQMPRKNTQYLPNSSPNIKSTISQYFISRICASCSEPTQDGLCADCCRKPNITALRLTEKLKKWEENYNNTVLICQSCTGCLVDVVCASLDCPVLYRRTQTFNDLQQSTYVRELLTRASIFLEESYFG